MVVVGIAGQGKTTWGKWLAQQLDYVTVWDIQLKFDDIGLEVIRDLSKMERGRQAYQPSDVSQEHFDEWAGKAFSIWNQTAMIDEAQTYVRTSSFPLGSKDTYSLGRLISQGQNRRISIVAIGRRIADIHADLTSQAKIVSFRQTSPNDLAKLDDHVGEIRGIDINGNEAVFDAYTHVKTLPDHYWLWFDHSTWAIFPPIEVVGE